ncbi:MAG: hypothetical protein R3213_02050 [Flavobacteriaceae bacterium]|nr:hypothetical protein [Flavobacteriaceae bacterium]
MEAKKSIEQKLADKLVTEERVRDVIKNLGKSQRIDGLDITPVLGDWVYKDILETEVNLIAEESGQRQFSFKQFKKDVTIAVKPHLEKYIEEHKEDETKLKL